MEKGTLSNPFFGILCENVKILQSTNYIIWTKHYYSNSHFVCGFLLFVHPFSTHSQVSQYFHISKGSVKWGLLWNVFLENLAQIKNPMKISAYWKKFGIMKNVHIFEHSSVRDQKKRATPLTWCKYVWCFATKSDVKYEF